MEYEEFLEIKGDVLLQEYVDKYCQDYTFDDYCKDKYMEYDKK